MLNHFLRLRELWKSNTIPLYFVSPTPFNLLGMENLIGQFQFISYIDTFDKRHPKVYIPPRTLTPVFNHLEEINYYLLSHKRVIEKIKRDRKPLSSQDPASKVLFLFFDPTIEEVVKDLQMEILFPSHEDRTKHDNKLDITQLATKVGVQSVPHVIAKVRSYRMLTQLAKRHNLGQSLVIQSAYGDSGKTTFFVENEAQYRQHAQDIETEDQVKVMKKIRCLSTAMEACATASGVYIGPLMRELIGIPELTPFKGGWCGNDLTLEAFSPDIRQQARVMAEKLGKALYKSGYRGYFEVDFLLDQDSNTLYLGEVNPRLSGISAMTNLSPFAQETVPLFFFHLMEWTQTPIQLSAKTFNDRVVREGAKGQTGQLILKYTAPDLRILVSAPATGIYTLDPKGNLILKKLTSNRLHAKNPDEIFLFRIMNTGEYVYKGADLGIVFINGTLLSPTYKLTKAAKMWITAVKHAFVFRELTEEETALVDRYQTPGSILKGD